MRLLLDTHALLWWLMDDEQLGTQARNLIADPGNDVLVSAVSLWEIVVKVRTGKLAADIAQISRTIEQEGLIQLNIGAAHLVTLGRLPLHPDHRDPFDHLLIAQAMAEDAAFVSADRHASRHASRYAVRVVACSDPPMRPPSG